MCQIDHFAVVFFSPGLDFKIYILFSSHRCAFKFSKTRETVKDIYLMRFDFIFLSFKTESLPASSHRCMSFRYVLFRDAKRNAIAARLNALYL